MLPAPAAPAALNCLSMSASSVASPVAIAAVTRSLFGRKVAKLPSRDSASPRRLCGAAPEQAAFVRCPRSSSMSSCITAFDRPAAAAAAASFSRRRMA